MTYYDLWSDRNRIDGSHSLDEVVSIARTCIEESDFTPADLIIFIWPDGNPSNLDSIQGKELEELLGKTEMTIENAARKVVDDYFYGDGQYEHILMQELKDVLDRETDVSRRTTEERYAAEDNKPKGETGTSGS